MKESKIALEETGEELLKAKKMCEKEGMKGWKLAQETMMKERASNPELQGAIEFVMFKYQPDYFRPALVSFCCKAVGINSEDTIPIGAALTLFAWAIGIHDDIIDQSKTKNRRPTVLGKYGRDLSLILSDVLLFKGFTLLPRTLKPDIPVDRLVKILETIEDVWFEQSQGEAFEIRHRGLMDITPEECVKKIKMRASEIDACARIGGIIGEGTAEQVERLGRYGRLIGIMGILRNEIIDMLEFDVLKGRIKKESLPLPVIYALQNSAIKTKLISIITKRRLAKEDLRKISKLSDSAGGIEKTSMLIDKMSKEAYGYGKSFRSKELKLLATPFQISPKEWKKLLSD